MCFGGGGVCMCVCVSVRGRGGGKHRRCQERTGSSKGKRCFAKQTSMVTAVCVWHNVLCNWSRVYVCMRVCVCVCVAKCVM